MNGVTLDAGGLIALDRNDRRVIALVARAAMSGSRVTVPACALAQALRAPARQLALAQARPETGGCASAEREPGGGAPQKKLRLTRFIRHPSTDLIPLDAHDATAVGILLAASRTSDIADAHVVVCARRSGQAVVTSDPDDIHHLDPGIEIVRV